MRIRLRYWTGLFVVVVAATGTALWQDDEAPSPVDDGPAVTGEPDLTASLAVETEPAIVPDSEPVAPDATVVEPDTAGTTRWSRVVGGGESLDMLLAEAGLDAVTRRGVSEALGSEYDLRRLQPGHSVSLEIGEDGAPREAALEVDDGVRILAVFGPTPSVDVVPPDLDPVHFAGVAEIGSSIYVALEAAGIPTRFATDLELVLVGTLDLRSTLAGGESLRIAWRENRLGDRTIGEPLIDFAQLELGAARYEILWPDEDSTLTRIYKDDRLVRSFEQPIAGARLSSAFGPRKHPIHNIVRMHSGVDFEAPLGADVLATQAGRIVFAGRKSGYGLMVEIDHGGDVHTIYAHLSSTNEALKEGQRVAAGDEIGRVGSSGTSTAPHLHYEIVVDGRPVSPLTDDRLRPPGRPDGTSAQQALDRAREGFDRVIARDGDSSGNKG